MNWLSDLFTGSGPAQAIVVLTCVITVGLGLARVKIGGVSLGITWILFAGIFAGHLGLTLQPETLHFMREFGLVLFVFSIGFQVGPSFFSSLKRGGVQLNLIAAGIVGAGVLCTLAVYFLTNLPITTVVGVMSGAITNTPGLGAAQQAVEDATGQADPTIAAGYAMAYPLGVLGIIAATVAIRKILRINIASQEQELAQTAAADADAARRHSLVIGNPQVVGKSLRELRAMIPHEFVISRIERAATGVVEMVDLDTVFHRGDHILLISRQSQLPFFETFFGQHLDRDLKAWDKLDTGYEGRRITVTKSKINGMSIGQLDMRQLHGVNVTRVNRAGVDLVATPHLRLQLGDRLTVVGNSAGLRSAEHALGNTLRRLDVPNLIPMFLGIVLGIIVGSIPFAIPGVPQPIKLGLAGGPLIVAILISRFGPSYRLVTYSTVSANLIVREIGISCFLAALGLATGPSFVATFTGGGYLWVAYGLAITVIPIIVVGLLARVVGKVNYVTLMGVIAGSTTDPPALAYAQSSTTSDAVTVGYATVYPVTMFLRVVVAQLLIALLL